MCGIAGIFISEGSSALEVKRFVRQMIHAQRERGPDGEGVWVDSHVGLGCARLLITGDAIEGAQPLRDRWGGYSVFNGEIYNYKEILQSLGETPAHDASDGAALAAILALKGTEGLNCVRGMFAGARYDSVRQTLLLVRDAVGKKPLYIRRFRDGWAFASTLSALHTVTGAMQLRDEAIYEYLVLRSVGGHHSAFRGVQQLPPGSWLELGANGHERSGKWWTLPTDCDSEATPDDVTREISEAVRQRAKPEAEVGLFLSGGLDSAIVAASLRQQCPEQAARLFFIGYDQEGIEDERPKARRLAKLLGWPAEDLELSARDVPRLLSEVACVTEDPIQDPVTLPTLALARAAANYTKVVLTGDGSDEVWGGYARFDDVPGTVEAYLPRAAIFEPTELGLEEFPRSYLDEIPMPPAHLAPLDRVLRIEVANRLRNYHLARLDKLTMHAGLEARCPFLDARVIALGLRLSSERKRPGGRAKGLLAAAFRHLLPAWLLQRTKQPFSVPIRAWLDGPLREFAADTLLSSNAFTRAFVDASPLLAQPDANDATSDSRAAKIWSLLQLEVWHRDFASKLEVSLCQIQQ
jgi:asparagine synthase (glutamine-hydrolysing)